MGSDKARIARLEKYLEVDPENRMLLADLARAYEECRDYTGAIRCYQRMWELGEQGPALLNAFGRAELAVNRLDEAIEHFKAALNQDPGAAPILFNLGYAELARDNPEHAARHFEAALALAPEQAQYHFYRAMAYDAMGQSDEAKAGYAATLKLQPDHVDARLFKTLSEFEGGQLESGRHELELLLQKHPDSHEGLILKAQMKLVDCEPRAALDLIEKAESIAPENEDTALAKGQAFLMLQRTRQARQSLKRARELAPDSATVLSTGAWAAVLEGDVTEAHTLFDASVAKDAELADGHAGLAIIAFLQNDDATARQRMERALALDAQNMPAQMVKNMLLEKRGNSQEAADGIKALFEEYTVGPFGWTPKRMIEKFASSEAGARALKKAMRLRHRASVH